MIKFLIVVVLAVALYFYFSYDDSPVQPQPQPQPVRTVDIEGTLHAAAKISGVVIKSFSQTGKEARVRVEWGGDVATLGGDFMEVLFRDNNIRDVEVAGNNVYYDRQQRRVWSQDFLVKLR